MEETLSKGRSEKYVKLKEILGRIAEFTEKDPLRDLERLEELMVQIPKVAKELEARGLVSRKAEIDANFENVDGKKLLAEIFGIEQETEQVEQRIEVENITLKEGVLAFGRTCYKGFARMNDLALASLMVSGTENQEFTEDESNIGAQKVLRNQGKIDKGAKYFFRDMSSSVIERIEKSMDREEKNTDVRYTDIKDILNQISIEKAEEK